MLAMDHGRRSGKPLHYAVARAAFWLYNDLPMMLETLLFPDSVALPVRPLCCGGCRVLRSGVSISTNQASLTKGVRSSSVLTAPMASEHLSFGGVGMDNHCRDGCALQDP